MFYVIVVGGPITFIYSRLFCCTDAETTESKIGLSVGRDRGVYDPDNDMFEPVTHSGLPPPKQ